MIYKYKNISINTNLIGSSFNKLETGIWKLGLISDNIDIIDENSCHYETTTINNMINIEEERKILKNKVFVKLINGERVYAHIIHFDKIGKYFCITEDTFWDQFEN